MTEKVSTIPEYKKELVTKLAEKLKKAHTVLVASVKGLPASQFQKIKKSFRGKAEVIVAKRTLVGRAIDKAGKGALENLKEKIGADVVLFLSEIDAFELSGMLSEKQSPTKAKKGDIAPEDITIEAGPTDLLPGPAISELGAVGLKVVVENGKLSIKQGKTVTKAGEEINAKVADVLSKLNITPMKVGFIPVAAYDSGADKTYFDVRIDKKGTLESLREAISKSLGLSIGVGYVVKENIGMFIGRAGREEKAIEGLIGKTKPAEKEEVQINNDKEVTE